MELTQEETQIIKSLNSKELSVSFKFRTFKWSKKVDIEKALRRYRDMRSRELKRLQLIDREIAILENKLNNLSE